MTPSRRPLPTQQMVIHATFQPHRAPHHRQPRQSTYNPFTPDQVLPHYHQCGKCYLHQPLSLYHLFPAPQCSTTRHSHHGHISWFHFHHPLDHDDTSGRVCRGWRAMVWRTNNLLLALIRSAVVDVVFIWVTLFKLRHKCDQVYWQRKLGFPFD